MCLDTLNLSKETKKEMFIDSIKLSNDLEDADLKKSTLLELVRILETKKYATALADMLDTDFNSMNGVDIYDTLADISAVMNVDSGVSYKDISKEINSGNLDFTYLYIKDVNDLLHSRMISTKGLYKGIKTLQTNNSFHYLLTDWLETYYGLSFNDLYVMDIDNLVPIITEITDSLLDITERKLININSINFSLANSK